MLLSRKSTWTWIAAIATACVIAISGCLLSTGDVTGAPATGERLLRMQASPQWNSQLERFGNVLERIDGSWAKMLVQFFFGGSDFREPRNLPPIELVPTPNFSENPDGELRITWLGHSSFLVELDGIRTLVDPVWADRASPFTWAGPKRFYPPPIALHQLPPIDAVVISHDHYDHLDRDTVVALAKAPIEWIVPIGVGAHLEYWGIRPDSIVELDWWQSHQIGDVSLTATPSRHFSGRSITFSDQNATLWAGWSWRGRTRSLFYSGDTALHNQFTEIGNRLGPFDVTLMEVGAYNELWADVHLGPEQALIAHQLVQGDILIPVHWGLFDLALHGWTEPAERVIRAAKKLEIEVAILRPGATFDMQQAPSIDRWWPPTPWETLQHAPAWSSGVEGLQTPWKDLLAEPPPPNSN